MIVAFQDCSFRQIAHHQRILKHRIHWVLTHGSLDQRRLSGICFSFVSLVNLAIATSNRPVLRPIHHLSSIDPSILSTWTLLLIKILRPNPLGHYLRHQPAPTPARQTPSPLRSAAPPENRLRRPPSLRRATSTTSRAMEALALAAISRVDG